MQETPVRFLGWEDPLEKGQATPSSILGLPLWLKNLGRSTGEGIGYPLQYSWASLVAKESVCNAGDLGSIPGLRRSPGEGIGYPLQYSWASLVAKFSSVAQSCPTLCDPMNCSTPGLPIHHQLPEFTQTHVHQVSNAIQPSHPLSFPFPPAPNPSQHQSLFQ